MDGSEFRATAGPLLTGPPPAEADVVVAGAGPAGSTVAGLLAELGYRVVVLERDPFPRYHVGESLTPAVEPLFKFMGVGEAIQAAGFVRMPGHTFRWNGSEQTSDFTEPAAEEVLGYQVWRARFDRILLARARELGARVFTEQTVTGFIDGGGGRPEGVRFRGADRALRSIRARLVIDSTGMTGLLARALAARTPDSPPRSLAIWAYWAGAGDPPGRDAFNTYVESFPDGWIWTVRVRPDLRNVTVMVDLDESRQLIAGLGLRRFYLERISATEATCGFLDRARLAIRLRTCDASWYRAARTGGDGWLLTGDAASSIDPLTSQGVRKAIASGMTAAVVANTVLSDPSMAAAAWAYAGEEEERTYAAFRESAVRSLIAESRWCERPFWKRRTAEHLGMPGPLPGPPRRGVLRAMTRSVPLARLLLRWAPGARLEEKSFVARNILRTRKTVVTDATPGGIEAPDVDFELLFPLVAAGGPVTRVVDDYLAGAGRGRDGRDAMLGTIARLVDDGLLDVEII